MNIKNDIMLVSAFLDLKREEWGVHQRSKEEYIQYFRLLVSSTDYPICLFVEPSFEFYLKSIKELPSHVYIYSIHDVDTFLTKYIEVEKNIIQSDEYQSKIPESRKIHPEHWNASYNLLNHSKINFIQKASELYPLIPFFSWIDFGFVRHLHHTPKNIDTSFLPKDKIIRQVFQIPTQKFTPEEMLTKDDIYFTGAPFILHREIISLYQDLYEKKILEFHQRRVVDDDQNVTLQIYYDHPDIFENIVCDEWFELYNCLPFVKRDLGKVSVIIPTYNRFSLLQKAIESVLAQSYSNIEVIVVDDASTEIQYKENILEKMYPTVKFIHLPINLREYYQISAAQGKVREIGVLESTGEWIAFLDDDDIWLPRKLEIQLNILQKNPHGLFSSTNAFIKNELNLQNRLNDFLCCPLQGGNLDCFKNPNDFMKKKYFEGGLPLVFTKELIEKNNLIIHSSSLFHRTLFQKVGRIGFMKNEDWELWKKILNIVPCIYSPIPLIEYYMGNEKNYVYEK
jgi:GT2 family glycosyltransferase